MANTLSSLKEFIKEATASLPSKVEIDKQNIQFFKQTLSSLEAAEAILNDKNTKHVEEKEARVIDAATKWANQLVFILFRNNLMTPELDSKYRLFEPFETTAETAKKFYDEREQQKQEYIDGMNKLAEIDQDIDVFMAVLAGKSKKEAKELVEQAAQNGGSVAGAK